MDAWTIIAIGFLLVVVFVVYEVYTAISGVENFLGNLNPFNWHLLSHASVNTPVTGTLNEQLKNAGSGTPTVINTPTGSAYFNGINSSVGPL